MLTFCHAESDVYLVRLGGAGLILHADEQARRLRTSKAKRYTAVKDLKIELFAAGGDNGNESFESRFLCTGTRLCYTTDLWRTDIHVLVYIIENRGAKRLMVLTGAECDIVSGSASGRASYRRSDSAKVLRSYRRSDADRTSYRRSDPEKLLP